MDRDFDAFYLVQREAIYSPFPTGNGIDLAA